MARNGTGVTTVADAARQAGRHPVRLHRALQPARRAGADRAEAKDVHLVDLQPQASSRPGPRGHRRGLHLAADPGRAAQDRQGADHQPRAGRRRQADPRPGRGVRPRSPTTTRTRSTPGARQARALKRSTTTRPRPRRRSPPSWADAGGRREAAQAGRVPDAGAADLAGLAGHRRRAGQGRGEPAERLAVPGRAEADPAAAPLDVPEGDLHEGSARCPRSDLKTPPAARQRGDPDGRGATATAAGATGHGAGAGRPRPSSPGSSWCWSARPAAARAPCCG